MSVACQVMEEQLNMTEPKRDSLWLETVFLQDFFVEHKDKDSTFGKIYEKTLQTHLTISL